MLAIYALLREVLPLESLMGSSLLTYGFFGLGILLILWELAVSRDMLKKPNMYILLAFFLIGIISTLINFHYALVSNIKGMGWMFIYFFLAFPYGHSQREKLFADIRPVFYVLIVTMVVLVAASLPMYLWNVDYTFFNFNASGITSNAGFSKAYMRLWGVFQEANRAAIYVLVTMILAGYLAVKEKKLVVRILLVAAILFLNLYVVLALSRTAQLAMLVACGWAAFYVAFTKLRGKMVKKALISAGCFVLAMALCFLVTKGAATVLPYVKYAVQKNTTTEQNESIHLMYDAVYKASGVNITSGYWEVKDEILEPDEVEDVPAEPEVLERTDEKEDVTNGRILRWMEGLMVFAKTPLIGTSPRGTVAYAKEHLPDTLMAQYNRVIHNGFLEVLAGTGILGFALVLLLMLKAAGTILKRTWTQEFNAELLMISVLLVVLVIAGVLTSDLFFILSFGGVFFWFALGCISERKCKR